MLGGELEVGHEHLKRYRESMEDYSSTMGVIAQDYGHDQNSKR